MKCFLAEPNPPLPLPGGVPAGRGGLAWQRETYLNDEVLSG